MTQEQQPWLHNLVLVLAAPTQVWSEADGQVRPLGAQGVFHADHRLLSRLTVTIDGDEPTPLASYPAADSASAHVFVSVPRALDTAGPDPTIRLERRREVTPGEVVERLTLTSTASRAVPCRLEVTVAADLAGLDHVKLGLPSRPRRPVTVTSRDAAWQEADVHAQVLAESGEVELLEDGTSVRCSWQVDLAPGQEVAREISVAVRHRSAVVVAPPEIVPWQVGVDSAERRLSPVLNRALDDLGLLRVALARAPDQDFVAAGVPWFPTLFGRDSLWIARMLLPVSTRLAGSTLRVLAAHQGLTLDATRGEEPGKILHELRSGPVALADEVPGTGSRAEDRVLPPLYYGTIDATALWVLTLHDAWRFGLPDREVEALLPAAVRALAWQVEYGDADGDHLLEYLDASGHGLTNQGWKDSGDAVRQDDGSLAVPPVALCEVQGYAYAAAHRGADLLEHFGRGGTDRWREWAERLRRAFHAAYWVEDDIGPFPAVALDGDKRPVASCTSNIGHLLGTGLLSAEQAAAVAARLTASDMLSGYGVRTLSARAAGYSSTGYHVGSVWPHDTAICLSGLVAEGRPEAGIVAEQLLAALDAFDGRPPELFAGDSRSDHPVPLPYPAACRPQGWSAAAAVSLLTSATGLVVDVPAQVVRASPVSPWPWGHTQITGWQAGNEPVELEVDERGRARGTWGSRQLPGAS